MGLKNIIHDNFLIYSITGLPDFSGNGEIFLKNLFIKNTIYIYDIIECFWSLNFFTEVESFQILSNKNSLLFEQSILLTGIVRLSKKTIYHLIIADNINYLNYISPIYNQFYYNPFLGGNVSGFCSNYAQELFFSKSFYRFLINSYIINLDYFFNYTNSISAVFLIYQSLLDFFFFLVFFIFLWVVALNAQNFLSKENQQYFDFFLSNNVSLSEKELGSYDDISHLLCIFFFFFGWFAFTYGLINLFNSSETSVFFIFIPFIFYALLFMPFCLLLDYSCGFINYLRGTAATSSFIIEFLFDYVTLFAFLMRNFVQNVRFLIILLVSFEINELIMFLDFNNKYRINIQKFISDNMSFNFSFKHISTQIYWVVSNTLLYLMYELAHTFFIITVQLSSFIIMVFWLFSFLYTYFTLETQEKFFYANRHLFLFKTNSY